MTQESISGQFIPYPCTGGCRHHLRLKDNPAEVSASETVSLECPACDIEKEVSGKEVKQILTFQATFA